MSSTGSGVETRGHHDTAAFSAQVHTRPRTAQRLAAAAVLLVLLWVAAMAVGVFGAGPPAEVWDAGGPNGGIPSTPTVGRFSADELESGARPTLVPLTAIPNESLARLEPLAELERRTARRRHTLAGRPRASGRGSRTSARRRTAPSGELGSKRRRIRRTKAPGSAAPARPVVTPKPVKPVRTPPATGRPMSPPQQQPESPGRPGKPGKPGKPGPPASPGKPGAAGRLERASVAANTEAANAPAARAQNRSVPARI